MEASETLLRAALARRLNPLSRRPLALAVSGGGDSAALLHMMARWAADAGRPLVVLTVDHRLQGASEAWSRHVHEQSAALGLPCRTLVWTGLKPAAGLPAAARQARHALLAEAAREVGAAVVLLGHTADDVMEGERMRAEVSTLGALREWAPSPAWPEGRGVFLLRPLLGTSRADLRVWLSGERIGWIEDPANADPRFARSRIRAELTARDGYARRTADLPVNAEPRQPCSAPASYTVSVDGRIRLPRAELGDRILARGVACAAGGLGRLRRDRVAALAARLREQGAVTATLGGARVVAIEEHVEIGREPGEIIRGGLHRLPLPVNTSVVWDGRFELRPAKPGLCAAPLRGAAARLPPDQRRALKTLPAWSRGALPAILDGEAVTCPLLGSSPVSARSLVADRFAAALGLVLREP